MIIVKSIDQWIGIFKDYQKNEQSVGLVPTMGALHRGHMSLIERSVKENEITAATIFVNPTQFNNPDDLTSYPVTWDEDVVLLENAGVDYLLYPSYKDVYRDNYRYKVVETEYSNDLCGSARPGHFDGVLTVVMKLLNITRATKAYFGEKDWQQYQLIKGMTEAFFIDTEIISCPLIREESGLALSSRNKRLTEEHKMIAPLFYKTISSGSNIEQMKKELTECGFVIDYLKIKDSRIFGAVFLGEVRLIDNVSI
ncbi:MAG: pantoate--beta-alanine ligase [Spirochaetaceae bacterium]|nr:pantoate--beta-alanine ligase [Spirochaetaceae bacterium]